MATQCAVGWLKEDLDFSSICMTMTWLIGLFFSYTKIVVKGMTKAEMILKVGGNHEFHVTVYDLNSFLLERLLSTADNLCKQFRPRSGCTECLSLSRSKWFDTLIVF